MRGGPAPERAHCAGVGIAVVPSHRSRGIGSDLLRCGLRWAKDRGLKRVELMVYAENVGAMRLYERLGFEVEGRHRAMIHKGGRLIDAFSMAVILDGQV